jgi:HEAT repeat protein
MTYKTIVVIAGILLATAAVCDTADRKKSITVEEAIQMVSRPGHAFDNMDDDVQTYLRLAELSEFSNYHFKKEDAGKWKSFVQNDKANLYGRMCGAYFLLADDPEARKFLKRQAKSENLRYRYNAARLFGLYLENNPTNEWAITELVELIGSGALDGSGITDSSQISGRFPDEDYIDIMRDPIGHICRCLSDQKVEKAVPALIGFVDRKPNLVWVWAVSALGKIGDQRAVPILLKKVDDKDDAGCFVIDALGELKSEAAVPILIAKLEHPKKEIFGRDVMEVETWEVLEALSNIGDKRAVEPIKGYLKTDHAPDLIRKANLALIQLNSTDPAKELLDLLHNDAYASERLEIFRILPKFKNTRVINAMSEMAKSSDSAFMRREAIDVLHQIGNRQALLELADLLKADFPQKLRPDGGWKMSPPDFSKYFPDFIAQSLAKSTKQDFGLDGGKWSEWIKENVKD